jgi:hypothetical protein
VRTSLKSLLQAIRRTLAL